MREKPRRAVITGVGMVTCLGTGVEPTWRAAIEGRSGIRAITRFDPAAHKTRIAGEVPDFNPDGYLDKKEVRKMDLFIQYAVAAAEEAMRDSALKVTAANAARVGVVIGSGIGGLATIERGKETLIQRGPGRISPFFLPAVLVNLAPGYVSIRYGAKGPVFSPVAACATGTNAIGDALELIRRGYADAVLAGGSEAPITALGVAAFNAMHALSTRNGEPERASRPFDRERDGFVISEGAGVVVVEEAQAARARGARIYAEVRGYGRTGDAYHYTAPPPEHEGAARCMALALEDAGLGAGDIDYVNAHGTSTPHNDAEETRAIKKVFGAHAHRLAVSSTKSMLGHALGATGAIEAILSALAIRDGIVPPTINLDNPDPECDLDYVPHRARPAAVRAAMTNSFGFGGTNTVLVLTSPGGA